jgi:hypothetical protein
MAKDKKIALTITANTRQLRTDMRKAGREVQTFERQVMGLGAKMRQVKMRMQSTGIFGRGGGALRTAAGFAGVFGFTQMIEGAKAGNAALTDIAITGNLTNKEMMALKKTMYEVSNNTAKSTQELGSFVATVTTMTGDAKGAASVLGDMGEIMVATGASGEALAGTYVKLTTTMGLVPKEAKKAINAFRAQEKMGSVTFANIAGNIGKIMSAGGVFGEEGRGLKGAKTFGALYQIAQRGFAVGQEGESATSAGAFLRFMGQRAKRIKKTFGVDIFDKGGKARDLPTVFEELGRAFNAKGEAFRTKGTLIFGRSGIRTAGQLKDLFGDPTGKGKKLFSDLMTKAGTVDVIGGDAARRRQSASYKFDEQLNILKNALKKHISPLFKTLADGMKKWGPDLVRTLKFLLENSAGLMKLWLGYKGITFFKRLMAPVEAAGGSGGGAAAAMQTMRAAAGGGRGMVMLPNGRMAPALATAELRSGWRKSGIQGEWVSSGRSGGQTYTGNMAGLGMAGMMASRVSTSGGWGAKGGVVGPSRWQRARGWVGGMAGRFGPGALRYGGMGAGAAGMMGAFGETGLGGMGANMALMSGNPYAMLAGGIYQGMGAINRAAGAGKVKQEDTAAGGLLVKLNRFSIHDAISKMTGKDAMIGDKKKIVAKLLAGRQGSGYRGWEHQENVDRMLGQFGGFMADGGVMGISPAQQMALAKKHGPRATGLKLMEGRFRGAAAQERADTVAAMKAAGMTGKGANGAYTEDQIKAESPQYAKLTDMVTALNKLIMKILSGKAITVNAVMPKGSNPGSRVDSNGAPALETPRELLE